MFKITNRASHLRGELKTKARPIVETFYNFESGINKKTLTRNRQIAEDLKDAYGYAYKVGINSRYVIYISLIFRHTDN